MPVDLNAAAAAVRESPLVDHGLLKPGGKAELLSAIDRWKGRGLRAHVFITERGDDLVPWRGLFETSSLDPQKDLLLLFNGTNWDARGWGLDRQRIDRALRTAEPGLKAYYARGLADALDELGQAATGSRSAAPDRRTEPGDGSSLGIVAGVAVSFSLAGLGWVLHRRKKMAGVRFAEFERTRLSAEQAYADVMLAAESLSDRGTEEKHRAAELKSHLDRLQLEAARRPLSADDPVLLGKVQQLENEMVAIHSVILQKAKGQ